ncbi:MAG: hypothetical protein V7606_104, partial [Burkholderiales bacterium]
MPPLSRCFPFLNRPQAPGPAGTLEPAVPRNVATGNQSAGCASLFPIRNAKQWLRSRLGSAEAPAPAAAPIRAVVANVPHLDLPALGAGLGLTFKEIAGDHPDGSGDVVSNAVLPSAGATSAVPAGRSNAGTRTLVSATSNPGESSSALSEANIEFEHDVPNSIRSIAPYVRAGLGSAFPAGHRDIFIFVDAALEEFGNTQVEGRLAAIAIKDLATAGNIGNPAGRYALTLTHEMYLHALPYLTESRDNREWGTTDAQHATAFMPASTTNGYLNAVRSVVRRLPDDEMKLAYLNEYAEDVGNLMRLYRTEHPEVDLTEASDW